MDAEDKRLLGALPVGRGIVKTLRFGRPILIQFPHIDVAKGAVTDSMVGALMKGNTTLSGARYSG